MDVLVILGQLTDAFVPRSTVSRDIVEQGTNAIGQLKENYVPMWFLLNKLRKKWHGSTLENIHSTYLVLVLW